jgi:aminoglycoside phosphotransferase (APT) family kinase protein
MSASVGAELPDPKVLERELVRDLAWLAARLGAEVASAVPVSPLRGHGRPRTAFQVSLSDGRTVKLRRMAAVERAAQLERLLAALAPLGFPHVLLRRGRTLALEWIPGTPLEAEGDPRAIERAAELLSRIHGTSRFGGRRLPAERPATEEFQLLDKELLVLVAAGRLTKGEGESLRREVRRRTSDRPLHGIAHGDFAQENLVVDGAGALRVVDNESIRVGILDLDLARVWSRWPMEPATWRAFLEAYSVASGRPCRDDDLAGWKIRTLVLSAWYRHAYGLDGVDAAVSRLRHLGASLH